MVTNQDGTMGTGEIPLTSLVITIINSQVDNAEIKVSETIDIISDTFPIALGLCFINANNITIDMNL